MASEADRTQEALDVAVKAISEWILNRVDCQCDEPEKGHESLTCMDYFAFREALEQVRKLLGKE